MAKPELYALHMRVRHGVRTYACVAHVASGVYSVLARVRLDAGAAGDSCIAYLDWIGLNNSRG